MEGGRTFGVDAFLNFMPAQEGEAWEKPEEYHPSVLPLSTAPAPEKPLQAENFFFLSVTALQR